MEFMLNDNWLSGLGDADAAKALAALGLLARLAEQPLERIASEPDCLAEELAKHGRYESYVPWGTTRTVDCDRAQDRLSAVIAIQVWEEYATLWTHPADDFPDPRVDRLRLWIPASYLHINQVYFELARRLLHPETRVSSLFFEWWGRPETVDRSHPPRTAWHWPLRVGFVDEERDLYLETADRWRASHPGIVDFLILGEGGEACDLLLSRIPPEPLREILQACRGRASAVALFEQPPPVDETTLRALVDLRDAARASAVAVVPDVRVEPHGVLHSLLREISHNEPLDTALQRAARQVSGQPSPVLTISDPGFMAATRLTATATRQLARFAARGLADEATELRNSLPELRYDMESQGATRIYERSRDLEERAGAAPARYLQADTWHADDECRDRLQTRGPARAFAAERWHVVDVHVGPLRADETTELAPFPEEKIDWRSGRETLQVALATPDAQVVALRAHPFQEEDGMRFRGADYCRFELPDRNDAPGAEDGGAMASIEIETTGPSTHAFFALRPNPGVERVEARLLLVHANRILQTALLSAEVTEPPQALETLSGDEGTEASFIPLRPEGVTRASLVDLDDRMVFDGAFLINRRQDGDPLLTALAGTRVALSDFKDGKDAAQRVRDQLDKLVARPETFLEPGSEAMRALLVGLAREGVRLYRRMVVDNGLEAKLGAPGARVQLVMVRPDAFVPLELVYDEPAPAPDAKLCPNRKTALEAGDCGDCPHRHDAGHVCPVRFWGLDRIIERHLFKPGQKPPADEPTVVEPVLDRPRFPAPPAGLFAHSDKAAEFDDGPAAMEKLQDRLRQVAGAGYVAATWKEWRELVEKHSPPLMLLLPHSDYDGEPWLEIGAGKPWIGDVDVGADVIGEGKHPKLVVLLGCDTADPQAAYANFTTHFRHAGADVIVGTLASVLGRHVAPVAEELLQELERAWRIDGQETTLGAVLTRLRRVFMDKGLPIGLALVAYGDADWVLGS